MSRPTVAAIRRRRIEVHDLREQHPELSLRELARRLGMPKSTVERDLNHPRPEPGAMPPGAAGPGNTRSRKHGAWSEGSIVPLRAEAVAYAAERWPWLPDADLARYGTLAARIKLLADFEEEHGVVRDPVRGEVFSTSMQLARFEAQLERLIQRFDGSQPPGGSRGSLDPRAAWPASVQAAAASIDTDDLQNAAIAGSARAFLLRVVGVDPTPRRPALDAGQPRPELEAGEPHYLVDDLGGPDAALT